MLQSKMEYRDLFSALNFDSDDAALAVNSVFVEFTHECTYWFKTQLLNFWASYKVVSSESFNFYSLGFRARKCIRTHVSCEAQEGSVSQRS